MKHIKLISYNIHKGFSAGNRDFILPQIREALQDVDPELIFLQEVQGKHRKRKLKKIESAEIPQTEFLADKHWPHALYAKNAVYGPAHHGNALLSKFPFTMWENINVALMPRASRSLLHGVITLAETQVHVICLHLGLFEAERKIQLTRLSERINEHIPAEAPLIIAGDFNDWRGMAENHLERELGLKEVYKVFHGQHAKTFPATRPAFRVDRIYYRKFGLAKAEVLDSLPWKKLSDHLPLYAELTL